MRNLACVLFAAAVSLAGCTTLQPTASPAALPATPAPVATSMAPATAAPSTQATSTLTERELSDRFWERAITYGRLAFDFRSLEDIVASSHLIVRGHIVGSARAPCPAAGGAPAPPDICGGPSNTFVIVTAVAVLKPDPRYAFGPIMVRIPFSGIPDAELPRGELVLFLHNDAQRFTDAGTPTPSDSPRWSWWILATSYQGALRNLDGVVDVPEAPEGWWETFGPFPSDIDGQPFDAVIDRISELVTT